MRIHGTPKRADQDCDADADPEHRVYHEFIVMCVDKRYIFFKLFLVVFSKINKYFRFFSGLFSTPKYLFPRKVFPATENDIARFSPILKEGDQLYNQVVILGTTYRPGFLLITKVISSDVLEVGEILKIVFRNGEVLFLLILSDAARNNLGFFEALPREQVTLTTFEALADYKPIIKRGDSTCYPFVLHHHVGPCSLPDDSD
jgi:hypothetical protein